MTEYEFGGPAPGADMEKIKELVAGLGEPQIPAGRYARRRFLRELETLWDHHPNMRFGQLIANLSPIQRPKETWEWSLESWMKAVRFAERNWWKEGRS